MKRLKQSALVPSKQGELDSLCGLYSVINALYWLYAPQLRRKPLFRLLTTHLNKDDAFEEYLTQGMETAQINDMLRFIQSVRHKRWPFTFTQPFLHTRLLTTQKILGRCARWLNQRPDRVVLLGDQYHWSVVTHIDDDWLYFFDSSTYTRISRTDLSLRNPSKHQLCREDIYFIARADDHDAR